MEMDKITESIYEGARLEAIWSKRQIIPERWEDRDEKFRNQMVDIVGKYLSAEKLPNFLNQIRELKKNLDQTINELGQNIGSGAHFNIPHSYLGERVFNDTWTTFVPN